MLKMAALYAKEITELDCELSQTEYGRYLYTPDIDTSYKPDGAVWSSIDKVSVSDGKVIGYFHCRVDRLIPAALGLWIINYTMNKSITFSRDFAKYIDDIFVFYGMAKLNYSVYVGNPAEKQWDKFTFKYGGRIVGTKERDIMLMDGTIVDLKMYELTRENYLKNKH
jgi:hypothetical protein